MNKNKLYLFCLMLGICAVCQAQTLSVRPYVNYHHSVSAQTEPVFHHTHRMTMGIGGMIEHFMPASSFNENFTLSSGFEYGIAVDYRFRNGLGIELGVGYFSSINSSFDSPYATNNSLRNSRLTIGNIQRSYELTNWSYSSFIVRPLFSYAVTSGKSAFIGKVGPTFHYSMTKITVPSRIDNEILSSCTFANKWSLGYSVGFEYNYRLSERLHLAVNFGYEWHRYTPSKSTIRTIDWWDLDSFIRYEMRYVNKIVGEPSRNPNENNMLKESILFNNIHFGIGIRYNLWKR